MSGNKNYYECHVTFTAGRSQRYELQKIVEGTKGWRFSAIDGDTNLGDGVKFYATIQRNGRIPLDKVVPELLAMGSTLRFAGANVLREKVEIVVYDTRSSKVQCLDCATCQEARADG